MNEIELIRRQLTVERAHTLEVSAVCAEQLLKVAHPSESLLQAARDYLAAALLSFTQRDARLASLARRLPGGEPAREALNAALEKQGGSDHAQALLARESWGELADYLSGAWRSRGELIDAHLTANIKRAGWRDVAGIDADSILGERARYERLQRALAPGVTLASP